ncbi:hypothetical protein BX666DRAFT_771920 [Dichotomocladium elegans]|nr:hypothetical protein BX666DRAFT_771920 [Dichotomocladium elegans]
MQGYFALGYIRTHCSGEKACNRNRFAPKICSSSLTAVGTVTGEDSKRVDCHAVHRGCSCDPSLHARIIFGEFGSGIQIQSNPHPSTLPNLGIVPRTTFFFYCQEIIPQKSR